MLKFSSLAVFVAATSAIAMFSPPALAAATVKVIESGEGGGAMTLKLDPPTANPGAVTFNVHNDAVTEEHEMVLVKLKSADQKIPFNAKKDRVDEKRLKSLGEVSELKPGADGKLTVDLKAGTYLLLCNIKGHYSAGMHGLLTVSP